MAMNVNNWYMDPAQRYNDVIFPQKDRAQREWDWEHSRKQGVPRKQGWEHPDTEWVRYDRKTNAVDNTPTRELSSAAQKLLDKLKKTYDNVDFMVAGSNNSADAKAKLAGGSGKYSVLFTNDELEKMASDPKYQKSMLNKMHEGFQQTASANANMGLKVNDLSKTENAC